MLTISAYDLNYKGYGKGIFNAKALPIPNRDSYAFFVFFAVKFI